MLLSQEINFEQIRKIAEGGFTNKPTSKQNCMEVGLNA